ncbi:YcxB family protein [Marinospirillum sp.]|uniref:YcxB family protein n=1 Tax=Marinospirillum sp. TaxID=2183934 RepID=UPI003A84B09E
MRIDYAWSEPQFVRQALYDYEVGPRRQRQRLLLGLTLVTVLGLILINMSYRGFSFSIWDLVLIAAVLCWYTLRGTLLTWSLGRAYRRSGIDGVKLAYEVDESGVKLKVNQAAEQSWPWSQMKRVVRTREGFLLYPGPMWLPLRHFPEDVNPDEFAALLQRKVVDYQDHSQHQLKLKDDF